MFDFIRGTLVHKSVPHIVVETNGVGYRLEVPLSVCEKIELQEELTIYVHTVFRNDTLNLLGFASRAERQFFYALTGVSKVGPKLALNILSTFSVEEAATLIQEQDLAQLRRVPGLGQKTARLLIADLGDKDLLPQPLAEDQSQFQQAVEALVFLGYKRKEAADTIHRIKDPHLNTEQLVRQALKNLT